MKTIFRIFLGSMIFVLGSCRKKTVPHAPTGSPDPVIVAPKVAPPRKVKVPTPKMIMVNDEKASKTFDGRLYYDLEGHRYWRNYKDGKYYLFNKSMATDPDFKKP